MLTKYFSLFDALFYPLCRSAYSDVLIVDGFSHPSLFRLPASSFSLLSSADPLLGDRRRPFSSPAKISRSPIERGGEEEGDTNAAEVDVSDKGGGVGMVLASPFTEKKSEVSVSTRAPGRSEEIATSKSILKAQVEEFKNILLKPTSSVEPTLRAKKSIIHFSPQVLEQDKGNIGDNGERSVHTTSSKSTTRETSAHFARDAHGDANDNAKELFTINRRNAHLKGNYSLHRASSAGASSNIVINTAAASHPEAVSIAQRNNTVLEILMPFKDWR